MTFKEKDIRDPDVLKHYFVLLEKDSAKILASDNSIERIDQKKWGLDAAVVEFEKGGYNYEKCIETDTLFINPRPKFEVLSEFIRKNKASFKLLLLSLQSLYPCLIVLRYLFVGETLFVFFVCI